MKVTATYDYVAQCNHIEQTNFVQSKCEFAIHMYLKGVERTSGRPFKKETFIQLSFPIGNKFGLFHYCVGGGFKRRKVEERSWPAHGVQHTPMGGHLVKMQLPVLLSATYVCFIPNSFSLVT